MPARAGGWGLGPGAWGLGPGAGGRGERTRTRGALFFGLGAKRSRKGTRRPQASPALPLASPWCDRTVQARGHGHGPTRRDLHRQRRRRRRRRRAVREGHERPPPLPRRPVPAHSLLAPAHEPLAGLKAKRVIPGTLGCRDIQAGSRTVSCPSGPAGNPASPSSTGCHPPEGFRSDHKQRPRGPSKRKQEPRKATKETETRRERQGGRNDPHGEGRVRSQETRAAPIDRRGRGRTKGGSPTCPRTRVFAVRSPNRVPGTGPHGAHLGNPDRGGGCACAPGTAPPTRTSSTTVTPSRPTFPHWVSTVAQQSPAQPCSSASGPA